MATLESHQIYHLSFSNWSLKKVPSSTHHRSEKKITTSFCSDRIASYKGYTNPVSNESESKPKLSSPLYIEYYNKHLIRVTLRKIHFKKNKKKTYVKSKNC